tara:strand:+ start:323 stop:460 length:138 start_codon:yes stop_codon:yes gene_type:complete
VPSTPGRIRRAFSVRFGAIARDALTVSRASNANDPRVREGEREKK